MDNSAEHVRVGIQIRNQTIPFRLTAPFSSSDGALTLSGAYTATVEEPATPPRWGHRLKTFQTRTEANEFAEKIGQSLTPVEVRTLGRPVRWGDTELKAEVWTVVFGDVPDPDDVPALVDRYVQPQAFELDLVAYEDQVVAPDPIRLAQPDGGTIRLESELGDTIAVQSPVRLVPNDPAAPFELGEVRIGIEFHWDHVEALPFRGALELWADGARLTAVNELPLDDYLASLLGSEMRTDWPVEALAAQAVAARSTVLATRGRHHHGEAFDLCHDDHCQCYQGLSRESDTARQALETCKGALLAYEDHVADARYAKTCGGLSDHYKVAWEDWDMEYMRPVGCNRDGKPGDPIPADWSDEHVFRHVLVQVELQCMLGEEGLEDSGPASFPIACNPCVAPYPSSASEMEQLYRWQETYSGDWIREQVLARTGRDVGRIQGLEPLQRSVSGRIVYLRVAGSEGTVTVGKELKIRRLLSDTHLPSSAFIADADPGGGFRLEGLGWGHGVGLCQLGSAALAHRGWNWRELLSHYYPLSHIVQHSQR